MLRDVILERLKERQQPAVQPPAHMTPGEKRDLLQIAKKREQVSKSLIERAEAEPSNEEVAQ